MMNTGTTQEEFLKRGTNTKTNDEEDMISQKEWQQHLRKKRVETMDECFCSICMEVIVDATVSNPCGHIFCACCILCNQLLKKECPNCRACVTSTTRSRQMDNIISGMALRGEFPFDEFKQYLKRSDTVLKEEKVRNQQII